MLISITQPLINNPHPHYQHDHRVRIFFCIVANANAMYLRGTNHNNTRSLESCPSDSYFSPHERSCVCKEQAYHYNMYTNKCVFNCTLFSSDTNQSTCGKGLCNQETGQCVCVKGYDGVKCDINIKSVIQVFVMLYIICFIGVFFFEGWRYNVYLTKKNNHNANVDVSSGLVQQEFDIKYKLVGTLDISEYSECEAFTLIFLEALTIWLIIVLFLFFIVFVCIKECSTFF